MSNVSNLEMALRLAVAKDFTSLPPYGDQSYLASLDPTFITDAQAYLDNYNGGCPTPVNDPPVVTLIGPSSITITTNQTYSDQGVTITDDKDVGLTPIITGIPNVIMQGVYTITYTVTDSNGAVTAITRTLTILGAPTVTLVGAALTNVAFLGTYNELGATASDEYGTTLPVVIGGDSVDSSTAGSYNITYSATDPSSGVVTTVNRTIVVGANLQPTMSLNGPSLITLSVGDVYTEQGVTATDPETGDISASVQITGSVDTSTAGQYILTYQIFDPQGLIAMEGALTRTIQVDIVVALYPVISFADGSVADKTVTSPQSDIPIIWSGGGWINDLFQGAVDKDGNVLQITTTDVYPPTANSIAGTFVMAFSATDPSNGLTTTRLYTKIVTPTAASTYQVLKMDATDGTHILGAIDNSGTLRGFNSLNGSAVGPHIIEVEASITALSLKVSYTASVGALSLRAFNYSSNLWDVLGALTPTGYTMSPSVLAGSVYEQGASGKARLSVVYLSGTPVPSIDSQLVLEYI